MGLKNYSNAVKRSIRSCKKRNLTPKEASDYINSLKCMKKTNESMTPQGITWAYRRQDIIN